MTGIPYIELSKNESERERQLKKEASHGVVYITKDGERVELPRGGGERPALDRVVPHATLGFEEVRSDDPHIIAAVAREHGRTLEGDEYVAALEALSREKGWAVTWPKREKKQPAKKTKGKRGRPPKPCPDCDGAGCAACHDTGKKNWKRYI